MIICNINSYTNLLKIQKAYWKENTSSRKKTIIRVTKETNEHYNYYPCRVFDSEYKSHYKSPTAKTKFKYVDGIWIEAPATLDRDTYEEVWAKLEELCSIAILYLLVLYSS